DARRLVGLAGVGDDDVLERRVGGDRHLGVRDRHVVVVHHFLRPHGAVVSYGHALPVGHVSNVPASLPGTLKTCPTRPRKEHAMPAYLCVTCGSQFAPTPQPPPGCPVCDDERQYVPPGGQQWTTLDELRNDRRNVLRSQEPGLTGIGTEPAF